MAHNQQLVAPPESQVNASRHHAPLGCAGGESSQSFRGGRRRPGKKGGIKDLFSLIGFPPAYISVSLWKCTHFNWQDGGGRSVGGAAARDPSLGISSSERRLKGHIHHAEAEEWSIRCCTLLSCRGGIYLIDKRKISRIEKLRALSAGESFFLFFSLLAAQNSLQARLFISVSQCVSQGGLVCGKE